MDLITNRQIPPTRHPSRTRESEGAGVVSPHHQCAAEMKASFVLVPLLLVCAGRASSFVQLPCRFLSPGHFATVATRTSSLVCAAGLEFDDDVDANAVLAAKALLYEDMQNSRGRAADREGKLLADQVTPLDVPYETTLEGAFRTPLPKVKKVYTGGGGGFGGGGAREKMMKKKVKKESEMTAKEKQTRHQAATLLRDGCLHIQGALKKITATRVRACILREIQNARDMKEDDPTRTIEINALHGIDQERKGRCVINLPLRADRIQNFEAACAEADSTFVPGTSSDAIVDALNELLHPSDGALGPLWAELCGEDAPLYELCSLVTWPGSLRQSVHPDAAHQPNPPLFAAFIATQDITEEMGPTLFLPGTQLPGLMRAKFDDISTRQDMIAEFTTPKAALLKAGDLAIFDMRCLHVGQANHPDSGKCRVLFNLTFRNTAADEPIGYEGSIRPQYFQNFTLRGMQRELERGRAKGDAYADVA